MTQQLDEAWAAAKAAPFPEPEEALTDVYVYLLTETRAQRRLTGQEDRWSPKPPRAR